MRAVIAVAAFAVAAQAAAVPQNGITVGGVTLPQEPNDPPSGVNPPSGAGNGTATPPTGPSMPPSGSGPSTPPSGTGSHDGSHDGSSGTYTYTPYYPSGGYKPPPSYPSGCAYSTSKPYDASSYTGDYGEPSHPYNPSYPAEGDYGQPKNYGYDYKPDGYEKPEGYEVSYPSKGEHVTCGKPYTFKWSGPTGKKVQIELVYGYGEHDCHHYTVIKDDYDNTGSYTWTPPKSLPPTGGSYGYGIKVTCKDTGKIIYSPQFCFDNYDFYSEYKHPACPTEKPTPITIPCPTYSAAPYPVTTPCPTSTPVPYPVSTPAAPAVVPVAPNATSPEAPTFTGAASGLKASMTFVAGLAVLVAFAL